MCIQLLKKTQHILLPIFPNLAKTTTTSATRAYEKRVPRKRKLDDSMNVDCWD